jgi:hypothetical protein
MAAIGETQDSAGNITDKANRLIATVERISREPDVFKDTEVYLLDTLGQKKREAASAVGVGLEVIGALGLSEIFYRTPADDFKSSDGRSGTRTIMQALDGQVSLEWIELTARKGQAAEVQLVAKPAECPPHR